MRLVEDGKIAFDFGWLAGYQAVRYDNGIAVVVMSSDNASWVRKKVRHVKRIGFSNKMQERKMFEITIKNKIQ
jgi:hypothetical protein